ncbi:amino acid permease [Aspergillus arachidicola]|uniref:Amino acid permease n=1 Tax=Aspergillus arachidicola TaxID=656916 RepID=A0A2G7EM27_9EURO|nr:amino acid permease [Aspergillus arachidicola]
MVSLNSVKGGPQVSTTYGDEAAQGGHFVPAKYRGTVKDQADMSALGREQVLRRNFRFISIVGFGCTLIATWEVILTLLEQGLTDGGTAGLIWGFLIVACGFLLVFLSLAEMASMAPTSGGQYHWVSEFAPRSCQKFLSYITGWLCAMGWQCAIVSIAFLAGTIIQGLIVLNHDDYVFERWHGTLLVIAITFFGILFNTFLAKKLPFVEVLILILHVVGLFAIIIPLWVLAPRRSAQQVFTEFNNGGGWNSAGTATLVGFSTTITALIGYDCAVHMSEEIKDASETLPKAMITSVLINDCAGFLMLVTICFTLGDIDESSRHEHYDRDLGSYAHREYDHGIGHSLSAALVFCPRWRSSIFWVFGYVTPGWNIPLNAVMVSLMVTVLLSLINIGSTTALLAIVTLTIGSLMSSYVITIGCLLLKRIRGEPLPPRRWSLGRFGMAINIGALCFLVPVFVFAFFPLTSTVDRESMNWCVVMYGGIMIIAILYYIFRGRHVYIPPVALVKRDI